MSYQTYQYPAGTYQYNQTADSQHLYQNVDGQNLYYYDYNAYQQPSQLQTWFNYRDPSYLKGLAVGAGVALLVANPTVQKAIVSGAVKLWSGLQGGVEEMKEHVKDVKAEVSSKD